MWRNPLKWLILLSTFGMISNPAFSQRSDKPIDLTELSFEELMGIKVTLVSRKPEKFSEAAAAVYVLTQDDLKRSGANTIPDALRLVPGVQVARIDANKWAVSSRWFNDLFDNAVFENQETALDAWSVSRGGFRMDWNLSRNQSTSLQGDLYDGKVRRQPSKQFSPCTVLDAGLHTIHFW